MWSARWDPTAAVKFWYRNAIENRLKTLCVAAALLLGLPAAAAEPAIAPPPRVEPAESDADLLNARLADLETYSASFVQEIQGARGETLERSTGRVLLKRPAFRWEVDDPFPQVLVADEALLKIYDPDLEQLTIRPMDEALADTPISLLSRDEVVLSESFAVTRIPDAAMESYVVVPRSPDALYAEIRLVFDAQSLVGLGILDHLGQFTQIRFEPDASTPVLQSSDFQLEVPPETDVIGG